MDFDIKKHTILLSVAGSRAYGIHTEESDIDVKGVAIPPIQYYTGYLHHFEQADNSEHLKSFIELMTNKEKDVISKTKLEGSIYEIRKFIKLAADSNPNILDVLFCRDEEIRFINPLGEILRNNRDLFISAKAKYTFSGYATAQLKRIKTHRKWLLNPPTHRPTREEFDLPEASSISREQLNAAEAAIAKKLDSWEIDFLDMPEHEKIYVQEQIVKYLSEINCARDIHWKSAARILSFDENFLVLLDKERKYKEASNQWQQYNHWKESRNEYRAALEAKYGYDTKHGAHLYRLMTMAKEILLDGKVNVYRGDIDAELILAIRNGAWPYEKLVEWAEAQDAELEALYRERKYSIPNQPSRQKIDELCQEIVLKGAFGGK